MTSENLGETLLPSSSYLPCQCPEDHWSYTDPLLFSRLPQGGGGIDWLTVTVYGELSEAGQTLCETLQEAKSLCASRKAVEDGRELGLEVSSVSYRRRVTISHPHDDLRELVLDYVGSGKGRAFNPLMVHVDGITVRYGRVMNSYPSTGGNQGPIGFIEIPGTIFLRNGEPRALAIADRVCQSLGIKVHSLRPLRVDVAADLPNQDVGEFVNAVMKGHYITKPQQKLAVYTDPRTKKPTGYTINSGCVMLRVYEKAMELVMRQDGEKSALMLQNRWGMPVDQATRVEFQFMLGKNRSKSYKNFEELCEGIGDLIGWAMNTWFRLCEIDDRTHTTRAVIVDCWLRALHAFAFWSARLSKRPMPKEVSRAPAQQLMRQNAGCLASTIARSGLEPEDEETVFAILSGYMDATEMCQKIRERAREYQGLYGTNGERGLPKLIASAASLEVVG